MVVQSQQGAHPTAAPEALSNTDGHFKPKY